MTDEKKHRGDCQCEECRIFYGWWIKKKYNLLAKQYHDIALEAFRLARKPIKSGKCTCGVCGHSLYASRKYRCVVKGCKCFDCGHGF